LNSVVLTILGIPEKSPKPPSLVLTDQKKKMKSQTTEELLLDALKKLQQTADGLCAPGSAHDEFLTRKEAAKRLKISLPTLHSYSKAGITPRHFLGNRILYKASEIDSAPQKVIGLDVNQKGGKKW
jgi:hypothetical protein